ncbi:MAG TPA: efflux RND transporter permease subunit [Rhizomicrobium sp.]|nr:efflux RND transporter permease subunit [Rhizomicrobium sp.]
MRALTRQSIKSPAVIGAAVAVTVLFGLLALYALPIQLFPEIDRPQIGIQTEWRAQTPREVEAQIIEPEEQVLQGIAGLQQMEGHASFGGAYINLSFALGTDMNATLVDVVGRLNRIPTLPQDAQKPLAQLANSQDPSAALLSIFLQKQPGNTNDIGSYERFIRDVVAPRLQAISGVGSVQFTGIDTTDELQIVFDPMRAAQLNIQIPKIAFQIGASDDISGGVIDAGHQKFGVSFRGRYSLDELKQTILDWRSGNPVLLGDIADVQIGQAKRQGFAYHNGQPALEINVFRASGANVLATAKAVKAELADINAGAAKEQNITLQYVADPTPFIHQAIGFLTFDLLLGIALAVGVLFFFMREWHATLIVSSAIPICLLAVIILLQLAGRSLNVVSLTGLAVASGMVLDAAIVVIENILRLREAGNSAEESAHLGTHQVWHALLASTATNVAIFLPVIFLKDVEGQLFADFALTIAFAVFVSLIVAITVVPVASTLFMRTKFRVHELSGIWGQITDRVMSMTDTPRERRLWIAGLIGGSLFCTWLFLPSVHYLPEVRRGVINVSFQYPPGATVGFADRELARPLIQRLAPYLSGDKDPQISDWYVKLDTPGYIDMSVWTEHTGDMTDMEDLLRHDIVKGLPYTASSVGEGSLFGGFDEGGGVSIDIQSSDLGAMREAARKGFALLTARFPDAVVDTQPSLDYDEPQIELRPNDRAIAEAGWSRVDVENLVQALGEGLYIGQRFDDGEQLYLILKSQPLDSPEALQNTPLATPSGGPIPFGNLVTAERTLAPSGVYTLNGQQAYALNFQPPQGLALGDALKTIRKKIEPQIRAALPGGSVTYGAAADHLDDALWAMASNFMLAVLILFAIMAVLFKSLRDAAIALIGLPLGTVGGVIALRILGLFVFQPLDLLTMIGFIVVLGLVVNNTILLVARTREAEAEGMSRVAAVRSSLETRLRPIFSSTLTALAGILPLVFIPGTGSEIYRGLGAVVVGGLLVSHVFTVFLMPAMLRLGESQYPVRQSPKRTPDAPPETAAEATA